MPGLMMGRNFGGHSARLGPMSPAPDEPGDPDILSDVRAIVYKHSLFHDYDVNGATPYSQDRSAGEWMHRMAAHMGKSLSFEAAGGQHYLWTMPPGNLANGGSQTRFNATTGSGIVNAGVDTLIFTPDNFTRNGSAPSNAPDNFTASFDQKSYTDDVIEIVERFEAFSGAPTPKVYIYDSWPKPPSQNAAGLAQMKEDSFNYFRSWAHQLRADVLARRPDLQVNLIHSAEIFADVMDNTPASALGYSDWFRDNAPHGNPSAYVIAGAIMFRQLYGELPLDFVPNSGESMNVHPAIRNNWGTIASYIDSRFANVGQNLTPGPVCAIGPHATFTLTTASSGTGIDLRLTGNAVPVALQSYQYSTDNGTTWRNLGATSGTVNLTQASNGGNLPSGSGVGLRLRAVNSDGNGRRSAVVSATTGNGSTSNGPSVIAALVDQTYGQSTGSQTYGCAFAFGGNGLSFALANTTAGVSINSNSGVVTINTGATGLLTNRTITVRASNGSGNVTSSFDLTVTDAQTGGSFVETTNGSANLRAFSSSYQAMTNPARPRLTFYAKLNLPSVQKFKTIIDASRNMLRWKGSGGLRLTLTDSSNAIVGDWTTTQEPALNTDYIVYMAADISAPTATVVIKPVGGAAMTLATDVPVRTGTGRLKNDAPFVIGYSSIAFGFSEVFVQYGDIVPLADIENNILSAGSPQYLVAGQRANADVTGDPTKGVNDRYNRGSGGSFDSLSGVWTDQ